MSKGATYQFSDEDLDLFVEACRSADDLPEAALEEAWREMARDAGSGAGDDWEEVVAHVAHLVAHETPEFRREQLIRAAREGDEGARKKLHSLMSEALRIVAIKLGTRGYSYHLDGAVAAVADELLSEMLAADGDISLFPNDDWLPLLDVRIQAMEQKVRQDARRMAAAGLDVAPLNADFGVLAWDGLLTEELPPLEFVIPKLVPVGEMTAIYSSPGVGKSLFLLECAIQLAVGGQILGEEVRQRKVGYIDLENSQRILRERIRAMGFVTREQEQALEENLVYSLLGDWLPYDTEAGGRQLAHFCETHGIDVLIIDTTQRVISGNENESDTFRNLHRHAWVALKRMGVTIVRLDHSGKDLEKGQRGSSGKNDDVALIYQLKRVGDRLVLTREKNRPGLDDSTTRLQVVRVKDPRLRHVLAGQWDAASVVDVREPVLEVMQRLDELGVSQDTGRPRAREVLREAGYRYSNELVAEAIKRRKSS